MFRGLIAYKLVFLYKKCKHILCVFVCTMPFNFVFSMNLFMCHFKPLGEALLPKLPITILYRIFSIVKTACQKIETLIHFMKFVSLEVAQYLCKSTTRPCMEYCCHVFITARILS